MDDLQYKMKAEYDKKNEEVLNLIINGWPSIPYQRDECRIYVRKKSFLYGGKIWTFFRNSRILNLLY